MKSQIGSNLTQPKKELTKEQKKLLANAHDEEKADEMMLAFEMLNKYKKNPNFIQKEMDEMKKKRDLLFIEEEKESKPKPG